MDNGTLLLNSVSYSGGGGSLLVNGVNYSGGGADISDTTATPGDVLLGKIFHLANGDRAEGELVVGGTFPPTTEIKQKIISTRSGQWVTVDFEEAPQKFICYCHQNVSFASYPISFGGTRTAFWDIKQDRVVFTLPQDYSSYIQKVTDTQYRFLGTSSSTTNHYIFYA